MPEAITKYAINSTLGTDDFKPLDRIITDSKGLVASSNDYYIIAGTWNKPASDSTETLGTSITFNVKGSAYIRATASNWSSNGYTRLTVYKNGAQVGYARWGSMSSRDDPITKSIFVTFKKGDTLTFSLQISGSNSVASSIENLRITADVIDLSGITVTEG